MVNHNNLTKLIQIEVVFADQEKQFAISLTLLTPCTMKEAIEKSGVLTHFPKIDLTKNKVGIYGEITSLYTHVESGARIEIYLPLLTDPKKNRINRAKKQKIAYKNIN